MFRRLLEIQLRERAGKSPIVVLNGPRQSGKTTLARNTFGDRPYVTLEAPDVRERAILDPRGFLAAFPDGAVLDEIQRAPELLSYLQVDVDEHRQPGRWILTGSQNLLLMSGVSQSLAGRAALLELMPFSLAELKQAGRLPADVWELIWRGGYPPLYDRNESPADWLGSYVATYVERDVRQLIRIGDLLTFQTFVRLAAGRTGQLVNLSQIGSDAGVSHNTAKSWLSVLETSYLCFRIAPFARNFSKRLVKTPKLHFLDSGLICYLLGIRTPDELRFHPLRGAVFESWVVSEVIKIHRNAGRDLRLSYFRDRQGLEVDLLVERGQKVLAVEAKSGATVSEDAFSSLAAVAALLTEVVQPMVVYGGRDSFSSRAGQAVAYHDLDSVDWLG